MQNDSVVPALGGAGDLRGDLDKNKVCKEKGLISGLQGQGVHSDASCCQGQAVRVQHGLRKRGCCCSLLRDLMAASCCGG
jgi:hypothetical protein